MKTVNKPVTDEPVKAVIEKAPSFAALTAAKTKLQGITDKLEAARKNHSQASTQFQTLGRRDDITLAAERLLSGDDAHPEIRKLSEDVKRFIREIAVLERAETLQKADVKRLEKAVSLEVSQSLRDRYVILLGKVTSAIRTLSLAIEDVDELLEEAEESGVRLRFQSVHPKFGTLVDDYSDLSDFLKEVEAAAEWPAVQPMKIRECTPRSIRQIDEDRARAARGARGATFDAA